MFWFSDPPNFQLIESSGSWRVSNSDSTAGANFDLFESFFKNALHLIGFVYGSLVLAVKKPPDPLSSPAPGTGGSRLSLTRSRLVPGILPLSVMLHPDLRMIGFALQRVIPGIGHMFLLLRFLACACRQLVFQSFIGANNTLLSIELALSALSIKAFCNSTVIRAAILVKLVF